MTCQTGQLKHWLRRNDSGVWGDDPDGDDDVEVLRSTDIALDGSWRRDEPAMRKISSRDRARKRSKSATWSLSRLAEARPTLERQQLLTKWSRYGGPHSRISSNG